MSNYCFNLLQERWAKGLFQIIWDVNKVQITSTKFKRENTQQSRCLIKGMTVQKVVAGVGDDG